MPITTRYIIAQMTRPFLATLVVAIVVLVIERMLRILDLVLGWRGGVRLVVELLAYVAPHYLGLALPVAFFLAVCLTFGRMSRDGELDAYFAAGLGLHQLAKPVFVAGGVLTLVTALTVGYLQPYARYAYEAAVHALTNVSIYSLLRQDAFTTLGDTTFIVDRLTDRGRRFEGAFTYTDDGEGRSTVTTARRGEIAADEASAGDLAFELRDGVTQTVQSPPALEEGGGRTPPAITYRFRRFRTTLEEGQAGVFRPRGGNEREWTLTELWRPVVGVLPEGVEPSEIRAELHGRLVRVATTPVLPLLAIPLALGRRRAARSYGVAVGLAVLIAYNEVIQFGEAGIEDELFPPWLGVWAPFAAFSVGALLLFHRAAFRLPGGRGRPGERVGALLEAGAARVRRRLFPDRAAHR